MPNPLNIAIIGLGAMGMGVATHAIQQGLNIYGVDLNLHALDQLQNQGARRVSQTANDFADELDIVVFLVVNAAQIRHILFEQKLIEKLRKETVVMLSSTISVQDAKDIAAILQAHQLLVLDAPLSGGALKAAQGQLTVMASGEAHVFEKVAPFLDVMAGKVYQAGTEIGKGSLVKIIHQLLAGVHIAAGAEAMAFAAKADIPLDLMYEVVTHSAGNSWMFENRMKHVVEGDYTPLSMVDIFVKDLGLVTEVAKSLHFPIPLASTALTMFTQASNAGFGKEDDAAVVKIFSGIQLPEKQSNQQGD